MSAALQRTPELRRPDTLPDASGRSPADPSTDVLPRARRLPWPLGLFLIGLFIPWIIPIGPLNMPVYRLALVITLLPCLRLWLRGDAGRILPADIAVLLYCVWAAICLVVVEGPGAAFQPAGVILVETAGGYLLARCYIRDAAGFRQMILFMTKIIAFLLPFLVYESLTGNKPLLSIFGTIFPTVEATLMTPRLGLWRVQGPFDHSIGYGAFCGSLFALVAFAGSDGMATAKRFLVTGLIGFAALLSMSSAPIAGVILQGALMIWDRVLGRYRYRWKILLGLLLAGYLVVAFGSNQTPVQFYISKFTFDHETGWYRIWIWNYGSASVLNHPLFGIGFHDWVRPAWMPSNSVDNFWLLTAMRYGLPAFALMAGAFLLMAFAVIRRKGVSPAAARCRTAFLISITAFAVVGTTVHFWDAPYAWLMFLLGSGGWLATGAMPNEPETTTVTRSAAVVEMSSYRRRHDNEPGIRRPLTARS